MNTSLIGDDVASVSLLSVTSLGNEGVLLNVILPDNCEDINILLGFASVY